MITTLRLAGLAALFLAVSPAAPALAHHGWSGYDESATIKVTAPLTDVRWANPHGTARVVWQKRIWDVVLAPVARMEARGLTSDMISKGQPVTLIGYPKSDGSREMRIERVIAGGKTVELR